MFTCEDKECVTISYKDALVISIILSSFNVHKVLVDDENIVNIILEDVMI
jgi:hypothetical protein